jgi:ribosome maturation factor RimP
MRSKEKIAELITKIINDENNELKNSDIFLVDVKVTSDNKISVFIDSEDGIKISDCAIINKLAESELDRESEDFELIVSSAGIDKPFKVIKQYIKNIGKSVEAQTIDGSKIIGTLKEVTDLFIVIEKLINQKNKNAEIEKLMFEHLKQVKLIITF